MTSFWPGAVGQGASPIDRLLRTTWNKEQEASKKAGYILSYEVIGVEPRGAEDPALLLVIRYKNWVALDGALAKGLGGRGEPGASRAIQDPENTRFCKRQSRFCTANAAASAWRGHQCPALV